MRPQLDPPSRAPFVFTALVISIAFLSYGPGDLHSSWMGLSLAVLMGALVFGWKTWRPSPRTQDLIPSQFPFGIAVLAVLLFATVTRFSGLTTFSTWPTGDEGTRGRTDFSRWNSCTSGMAAFYSDPVRCPLSSYGVSP